MKILIGQHTLERASERGAAVDEITQVLEQGVEFSAKYNKLAKYLVLDFKQSRNGKYYE